RTPPSILKTRVLSCPKIHTINNSRPSGRRSSLRRSQTERLIYATLRKYARTAALSLSRCCSQGAFQRRWSFWEEQPPVGLIRSTLRALVRKNFIGPLTFIKDKPMGVFGVPQFYTEKGRTN